MAAPNAGGNQGSSAAGNLGKNPPPISNFYVDIKPKSGAISDPIAFLEVSGLVSTYESSQAYQMGKNGDRVVINTLGNPTLQDVTIKRYYTDDGVLYNWHKQAVIDGDLTNARAEVSITLVGSDGTTMGVYTLKNAFPKQYTGPDVHAGQSELGTESLVLAHEGLSWTK